MPPETDEEADRREFLKTCGRFAAVTPPVMTVLLSTSLTSTAIARSGGGLSSGTSGDNGSDRSVFDNSPDDPPENAVAGGGGSDGRGDHQQSAQSSLENRDGNKLAGSAGGGFENKDGNKLAGSTGGSPVEIRIEQHSSRFDATSGGDGQRFASGAAGGDDPKWRNDKKSHDR